MAAEKEIVRAEGSCLCVQESKKALAREGCFLYVPPTLPHGAISSSELG